MVTGQGGTLSQAQAEEVGLEARHWGGAAQEGAKRAGGGHGQSHGWGSKVQGSRNQV